MKIEIDNRVTKKLEKFTTDFDKAISGAINEIAEENDRIARQMISALSIWYWRGKDE